MSLESGDGAVVKALASRPCGLGSIPGHVLFGNAFQTCPGVRKTVPLVVCFSNRKTSLKVGWSRTIYNFRHPVRAFCLLLLSLKLDQLSLLKHNYFFVGGEGGWVNGCKDDTGTNEAMDDSERNRLGSK